MKYPVWPSCCRGLNSCQCYVWPRIPNIALASDTANIPQNDVGNSLSQNICLIHSRQIADKGPGHLCFRCACAMTGHCRSSQVLRISPVIAPYSWRVTVTRLVIPNFRVLSTVNAFVQSRVTLYLRSLPLGTASKNKGSRLRVACALARFRGEYRPILHHRLQWAGLADPVAISTTLRDGESKNGAERSASLSKGRDTQCDVLRPCFLNFLEELRSHQKSSQPRFCAAARKEPELSSLLAMQSSSESGDVAVARMLIYHELGRQPWKHGGGLCHYS